MNGRSSPPERPHLQIPNQDPSRYSYRASGWTEETGYKNDAKHKTQVNMSAVSQDNFSARASIIGKLMLAAGLWATHHVLFAYVAVKLPTNLEDQRLGEDDIIEIDGKDHAARQSDILSLSPIDLGPSIVWWTRIGTLFAGLIALCLFAALRVGYDQIVCSRLKKQSQALGRLGKSLRILTGPMSSYTGMMSIVVMLTGWLLLLLPLAAPYCLTKELSTLRSAKNITMEMPSLDFTREAIRDKRVADYVTEYSWLHNTDEIAQQARQSWETWEGNRQGQNIYYQYNMTADTIYSRNHSDDRTSRSTWLDMRDNKLRTGLYNGPSPALKEQLLSTVYSGRIPSLENLPASSSYVANFFGPTIVCKDHGDSENNTAEWQQADKLVRDLDHELNFDRDHPDRHPTILYHAWVPEGPTFKIPDHLRPSIIRPRLDYQSTDSARIWILNNDGYHPTLSECALHNASYVVKWDFKDWKRPDPLKPGQFARAPQYSKAFILNVTALNPIATFNQTIEQELADHTGPNRISHERELELEARKAYMAFMEVLGGVLVGSYTRVADDPTDSYSVKQDARRPQYMTESLYGQIRRESRGLSAEGLENLMHKMTASLLGSDTWTIPKNDTVTIYEPITLLAYDPLILNISYAIPYALVLIICIIGLRCAKLNGGTFSSTFESTVLASTNIEQRLTGVKTDRRSVLRHVKVGVEAYLVANDGEWRRGPARKRKLRFVFEGEGLGEGRSDEIELTTLKTAPGERAGRVAVTEV